MKTKTINQSATFKAPAHEVYEALMDSHQHSKFTGSKCSISRKVGGKFSDYDGYNKGMNLELIPDRKIVQSWCGSDWPQGHYSQVTFLLNETGSINHLVFTQTGVPEEFYGSIYQGWHDYYWKTMKDMLGG